MATDTEMVNDTTRRGGFLGFLTTIPGILTACAALVTALGGLYAASNQQDRAAPEPPQPQIINVLPGALPDDSVSSSEPIDLGEVPDVSTNDPLQQMLDDCALGYLDACLNVLDTLSAECYEGYADSCDALYLISPIGSDYEDFGATCGGRFDWSYAGSCGAA